MGLRTLLATLSKFALPYPRGPAFSGCGLPFGWFWSLPPRATHGVFLLPLAGGSFRSFTRLYHGRQSLSHSSIWESFRSRLGSSASASPHKQTLPYTQTTGAACINTLWTQVFPAAASCPALKNGSFRKEIVVFAGQSPALKDRTFLPCCNFFPIFC